MSSRNLRADTVERRFVEQEHREIVGGSERIVHVAELAGSLSSPDFRDSLRELMSWVGRTVEPHLAWEEQWLFPQVGPTSESGWPARVLTFEHDQIRRAILALEGDREAIRLEPSHQRLGELRGHLYALDALLSAHLEREDRFLVPMLDEPHGAAPTGRARTA